VAANGLIEEICRVSSALELKVIDQRRANQNVRMSECQLWNTSPTAAVAWIGPSDGPVFDIDASF